MRSGDTIQINAAQVHAHARQWIDENLSFKDHGPK